ncbi:DUF4173 domain-containing protein [Streptomyces sp. NBC_00536]|uniref:DUF4153 domain-containing protein n=1 Tax=Streptomyces sp. NBC_00536 TaxID=2975769 RepID=UPI002E81B393|nr:DUF4173 domain-containing protein [Streptomyces sp. NBC_00536]WUC81690.1 DUF4173 domain-containing protein [Streptomyces sp. NBC_00536]
MTEQKPDGADGVDGAKGAAAPPGPAAAPPAQPTVEQARMAQHWERQRYWEAQQAARQAERLARKRARADGWSTALRPAEPAPIRTGTLIAALVSGVAAALLLGDGVGPGLLIAAVPAVAAACVAARAAGRRPRPWTLVWAVGSLALLVVPALRESAWPSTLAVLAAIGLGALALSGSRTWPGVLLSPLGFLEAAPTGLRWAWQGLRARRGGNGRDWWPVVRAGGVGLALLVVFGTLFASADAAFADVLGGLVPEVSGSDGPVRVLLFVLGVVVALAAARAAGAPLRWDRVTVAAGKPRSRVEWALPLVLLDLLFAGFIGVQLAVLLGGYDKVKERTGLLPAEYARQGFWQLLWATVLTLVVIGLALRWAPRSGPGDKRLVRGVLGALCLLTLVVVASAVRRMDFYVHAFGLTRLRVSVVTMELWLGVVIVLIIAAGIFGARWLPRAVMASAGVTVLVFGLLSPDGMIAESNVTRFEEQGEIDLAYFQSLSADAVPALDRLPEPERSCALRGINNDLAAEGEVPWYGMSLGDRRAREILRERPVKVLYDTCAGLGTSTVRPADGSGGR